MGHYTGDYKSTRSSRLKVITRNKIAIQNQHNSGKTIWHKITKGIRNVLEKGTTNIMMQVSQKDKNVLKMY